MLRRCRDRVKASQKLEVFLTRGIVSKNNRKHGFVSVSFVNQVNYDIAIAYVHDTRPLPKNGARMARTKKIVRREWTKEDVRQMKTMAKAKAGVTRIAKSLKRTPGATSVMAAKLGISLSMRA